MKRICLLTLAALALVTYSCKNAKTENAAVEEPFTEILGELDPKWVGDSVKVVIQDGLSEESHTYPVLDNMFAFSVPTDRMKIGGFILSYDGGVIGRFFIPEGGRIRVNVDSKGHVKVAPEKENSLTEKYMKMVDELDDIKYGMARKNNALAEKNHFTEEQRDSLRLIVDNMLTEKVKEQAYKIARTNRDDILGVLAVTNLLDQVDSREIRAILKEMSPAVRNHPAIPDSLKN